MQAARPNPTKATPVHKLITDKPIIKVPGCPPIPEVMSAVITYMLAFDRIPPLDRLGRPKCFMASEFMTNVTDARISMPVSLWKRGMTKAPERVLPVQDGL